MDTNWVASGNPTGGAIAVIRCLNAFIVKVLLDSATATRIQFAINDSASSTRVLTTVPAGLGVWTFFAASVTSTGAQCYAQNVASSSMTTVNLSPGTGATFDKSISTIGNQYGDASVAPVQSSLPFNGLIDDLRVYNTALSAAQVQSIYRAQGMPSRGVENNSSYIKNASGGDTVQTINGYRIHTFTTVGTSTFTPATSGLVDVLVVAGGGGGGANNASFTPGGGGGAGEVFYSTSYSVVPSPYVVTVGAGGSGGIQVGTIAAKKGSSSVFGSISTNGGGLAGSGQGGQNGGSGGSGGGGARGALGGVSIKTAGGYGNDGGSSTGTSGAGGGGALSVGGSTSTSAIGIGGIGISLNISGSMVTYGTGGDGGSRNNNTPGVNASANTGNGGGGAGSNGISANGGSGGSGIVIVRYPVSILMTNTPLFSQLSTAATSSAVGAFSLRAVNGTTAKAVQVRPQAQFPPAAMTSAATQAGNQFTQTLTGYTFGGSGAYVSNASSVYNSTTLSWRAFDGEGSGSYRWVSAATYVANTPYSGSASTTAGGVSYPGEWLQIQLPQAIVLSSYSILPQNTNIPATWNVFASNDGTTWTVIDQRGTPPTTGQYNNYTISGNPPAYSYYRMGCYIISLNTSFAIVEMQLFGSNASWNTDFYADRLGNLLTAPVTGQTLANWLGGATGYVTTWYDQSGKGNHATQTTAANQPTISGGGVIFSGTQNLFIPYSSALNTPQFTYYVGCTATVNNSAYRASISSRNGTTAQGWVQYFNPTNNRIEFWVGTGSSWSVNAGPNASLNTKYKLACRYDGTNMIGYTNGTSNTLPTSYSVNTVYSTAIGSASSGNFNFIGPVSDFLLFNSDIGDAAVATISSLLP